MKTADFLFYLYCAGCELLDRGRLSWVWQGPTGALVRVQRNKEYLERGNIYLHCMDLGIDMPEKFAAYQAIMDRAWPDRRFKG